MGIFTRLRNWLVGSSSPLMVPNPNHRLVITSFPVGANQSIRKWIEDFATDIQDFDVQGIKFYLPVPLAISIGMDDYLLADGNPCSWVKDDKPLDILVVSDVAGTVVGRYQIADAKLRIHRGDRHGLRIIEVVGKMTCLTP